MSKVIEIVVIGSAGSGKSHVLALIDKALRDGYGPHTKIVSRELSQERGLGSPGAEPSADTIFDLKERGPVSGLMTSKLKVEVDTSDIDAALVKAEALSLATAGLEPGQAVAGCFVIDPLESAISNIVREAQDAQGLTLTVLQDGLVRLLKIQREKLGGPVEPDLDDSEGALAKPGLTRVAG